MKHLLLVIFVFSSFLIQSQDYRTENNKAIKLYQEAQNYLRYEQFELSQLKLEAALGKDENFLDAQVLLAQILIQLGKTDTAKTLMKRTVETDPDFYPEIFFTLGSLELGDGNYDDAKKYLSKFLEYPSNYERQKYLAKLNIESCDFAIEAMKNPVEFNPENMGPNVNSEFPEYFPAVTADERMLLMTRRLPEQRSPTGANEEFYFSEKKDDVWSKSYNPGPPINSPNNEGAPTLSPDGKYIIFTVCELYGQYGPNRQGLGSCDLFISERIGKGWSNPMNMGKSINSQHWETQPSFASDGRTLYFIRGKRTRMGPSDPDIYTSVLEDGKWTMATPLSEVINSPEAEESVFIHPDNQTLYFSSRGHVGMGGMDIYMSRKDENGEWTKPVNLGYPINTSKDENSFHVTANGERALFASEREGGYGDLDLYSFELPEHLRPQPVTYLKGRITDAKTGRALEARFELIDLETDEVVVKSYSDQSTGEYLVCLPVNKSYGLSASKKGYLFHSENFELKEVENITHYEKNIKLQPLEAGRSVVLRNVFFDTDKYDLKPESKTELRRLSQLMLDNPKMRIEISGHTDSQGNAQDNQVLSQNRAKAVYTYLIETGIEAERLEYVGHGQEQPIATNDTEAGRAQNRRTEFKVVE